MPCYIAPKITGSCEAKYPAACCSEAPATRSNHLSPALVQVQVQGLVCGLTLCTSVMTKEDEENTAKTDGHAHVVW